MTFITLILMGCGGVGRQLISLVISCRSLHSMNGVRLRVVGVCDSNFLLCVPNVLDDELDDESLLKICELKSSGCSLKDNAADLSMCRLYSSGDIAIKIAEAAVTLRGSHGLAVIDCSASSETIKLLNTLVDLDCCVVLANKKPLTSPLVDYDKLVSKPRRIRHESTVGAGLPVISTINRIISSGDHIIRIIGSLSGTLGYVMSEVEAGKPFSEVVNAAKSLGYTEPDPRDDLSGMDVARKALILARLLGHRINMESIEIESLYPVEMGPDKMPLDNFMVNGLPLLDKDIQKRIEIASSKGNVLRYVCSIEELRCEVGIKEVSKDSALGRLKGSDNVLEIYSRCYREQPLVIQGAGAGNDTTAAGVLADILDMQDLFRH